VHEDDLRLAAACVDGADDALATLDATALAAAAQHARGTGLPAALVDDAVQLARIKLVMPDGDRPAGLRAYRGRGPLAAFVRTVVVRIAIDLLRKDRETPDTHLDAMLAGTAPDPELAYMRERYAASLGDALRVAWRGLAAHDRFILGLQLHEKLDLDAIATIYSIHRATAARRAASARAALVALTRDAIRRELAVGDATVDSILRIVTTSVAWRALADEPA
jgi:RNA polymerase sigma-70 factor, ECF subfamily